MTSLYSSLINQLANSKHILASQLSLVLFGSLELSLRKKIELQHLQKKIAHVEALLNIKSSLKKSSKITIRPDNCVVALQNQQKI